jgi:hypothetical protein
VKHWPSNVSSKWAIFGKQNWRCGMNRTRELRCPNQRSFQTPQKVLVDPDSRTVAMEVGIRQGVCNNSPAESTSPENGWRSSVVPILGRLCHATHRRVGGRGGGDKALGVSPGRTAPSADLGGSSNYSNENFEGRSGERFHVNSSWTWVSRS